MIRGPRSDCTLYYLHECFRMREAMVAPPTFPHIDPDMASTIGYHILAKYYELPRFSLRYALKQLLANHYCYFG